MALDRWVGTYGNSNSVSWMNRYIFARRLYDANNLLYLGWTILFLGEKLTPRFPATAHQTQLKTWDGMALSPKNKTEDSRLDKEYLAHPQWPITH